jgi:uncharacterized protein (TIGR02145 family)
MKRIIAISIASLLLLTYCKKDKKNSTASITTTTATSITSTNASTGGEITNDGGSAITQKGICWATHTDPTVSDSVINNGTGPGSFTSILTNLSPNTTYYVKAYAINGSGTGYGNEINFKTSAGLATITTSAISNIQPLSASSGGNITNDGGATITERGIVYATTANPTISNNKITAGTGVGSFNAILSPLASQQTYYVRAYATNSYGTSYGNQVQFNAASANTVTDIEGNVYPYVTIGNQSWMSSNLKVTKFKNGDPLTNGYTTANFNWSTSTQSAFTFPNGDANKKDSFGLLYNRFVINDARGVCPTGWHVPSDDEWMTLELNQGMSQADADLDGTYRGAIAPKLREGGASGLNLQLAGYLLHPTGAYIDFRKKGFYHTSTAATSITKWYRSLTSSSDPDAGGIYRDYNGYVMSIRCIKD